MTNEKTLRLSFRAASEKFATNIYLEAESGSIILKLGVYLVLLILIIQ